MSSGSGSGSASMEVHHHTSAIVARPYGPNGCEVSMNGGRCGETKTLRIIDEFRELYEEKMMQIDSIAGGDCTQAKIKLQQEWINDLTNQNELLVRAVEELELEATERVRMLEEKVKANANMAYEVMRKYRDFDFPINLGENFQSCNCMQNDINNLLEFIRRVRDEGQWSVEGLHFYQVNPEHLLGINNNFEPIEPYVDKSATTTEASEVMSEPQVIKVNSVNNRRVIRVAVDIIERVESCFPVAEPEAENYNIDTQA